VRVRVSLIRQSIELTDRAVISLAKTSDRGFPMVWKTMIIMSTPAHPEARNYFDEPAAVSPKYDHDPSSIICDKHIGVHPVRMTYTTSIGPHLIYYTLGPRYRA